MTMASMLVLVRRIGTTLFLTPIGTLGVVSPVSMLINIMLSRTRYGLRGATFENMVSLLVLRKQIHYWVCTTKSSDKAKLEDNIHKEKYGQ